MNPMVPVLIGGAALAAFALSRHSDAKEGPPGPKPTPRGGGVEPGPLPGPAKYDPNKITPNPTTDPKDPLPMLPLTDGPMPPGWEWIVTGGTVDQESDFVMKFEVDPAAVYWWATEGIAKSDPRVPQFLARAKTLLTRPERYITMPNGNWPGWADGLPIYLSYASADGRYPRPDGNINPQNLAEWALIMALETDLGKLADDLVTYRNGNHPKCAAAVAVKIKAQIAARIALNVPVPPLNLPADVAQGSPDMGGGAPSGGSPYTQIPQQQPINTPLRYTYRGG